VVVGNVNGLTHLLVLDLTVPTAPTVLGELATTVPVNTSGTGYMGVALNSTGTRAVMALGTTGIYVVDLTNPAAPTVLGSYNTPGTAFAVALDSTGTVAYVADGSLGHLQIVSLVNPSLPSLAGSLPVPGTQVDLALSGNLLYLVSTTGTFDVVDVTNPAAPRRIGSATNVMSGAGTHVAVEGSRVVILSSGTSSYLDIVDVSNPALPVRTASVSGVGGQGVTLVGGLAYVAAGTGGLTIYDVSTPTPVGTGAVNDDFLVNALAVSSNVAVVSGQYIPTATVRLQVLNVANPAAPTVVGQLPTTVPMNTSGTGYMGVALNSTGTRAVMALGTTGIYVVDLTNPAAPAVLGSYNTPGTAFAVALDSTGTVAYVADGSLGHLQIVNLTNPALPSLAGSLPVPGTQVDLALSGNLLYLVSNTGTFDIVDVTNPAAPRRIGSATNVMSGAGTHVAVEGSLVVILSSGASSYLDVVDVSNPALPVRVASVTLSGALGVTLAGGRAYVAANTGGLSIYDLAIPSSPVLLPAVATVGDARHVRVQNGFAYVADFPATIDVIDLVP
jgi:hypothetical protein